MWAVLDKPYHLHTQRNTVQRHPASEFAMRDMVGKKSLLQSLISEGWRQDFLEQLRGTDMTCGSSDSILKVKVLLPVVMMRM